MNIIASRGQCPKLIYSKSDKDTWNFIICYLPPSKKKNLVPCLENRKTSRSKTKKKYRTSQIKSTKRPLFIPTVFLVMSSQAWFKRYRPSLKMVVRIPPPILHFRPRVPSSLVTVSGSQGAATPGGGRVGGREGLTARAMSSATSPYTTLSERVSCEREIKKSKFIAIAAPISDERSAHSFLSEVLSSPFRPSRFNSFL